MARTPAATKAHWLHARLSPDKNRVALPRVSSILNSPARGIAKGAWVQAIETNYNHCDNYYKYRASGGLRVLWQRRGGKLRKTLTEGVAKIAVESPLRQDLRRHFGNNARTVIARLEKWHRERKLKPGEYADQVLSSAQRLFALKVAGKGTFTAHLAEWMFQKKKNWSALCARAADKLEYYHKSGFGTPIPEKFFRKPSEDEKKNWEGKGAKQYLTKVSKNLENHRKWLLWDLQWIRNSATTQRAAGDIQIFVSMTKVLKYRNALGDLLAKTERDDIFKNYLLPKKTIDELYVPYSVLRTRRGWKIGIQYGRKRGLSDKDMGFK